MYVRVNIVTGINVYCILVLSSSQCHIDLPGQAPLARPCWYKQRMAPSWSVKRWMSALPHRKRRRTGIAESAGSAGNEVGDGGWCWMPIYGLWKGLLKSRWNGCRAVGTSWSRPLMDPFFMFFFIFFFIFCIQFFHAFFRNSHSGHGFSRAADLQSHQDALKESRLLAACGWDSLKKLGFCIALHAVTPSNSCTACTRAVALTRNITEFD